MGMGSCPQSGTKPQCRVVSASHPPSGVPLGCLCAASCCTPPTPCCSQLWFPCRSEFTDTILSVHPSDVLDMPVDPNEPTYCLCHQVSYGEMIGCDNPDVSVGAGHRPGLRHCPRGDGVGCVAVHVCPHCGSPLCPAVSY